MQFGLLGWHNPFGRFPAYVIPVGRLDGKLVAVYPSGKKRADEISENAVYTHFTPEQLKSFQGFDYLEERLFAFDEHKVTRFSVRTEAQFFTKLLQDPEFCKDFAEMRESLQRVADGLVASH